MSDLRAAAERLAAYADAAAECAYTDQPAPICDHRPILRAEVDRARAALATQPESGLTVERLARALTAEASLLRKAVDDPDIMPIAAAAILAALDETPA